MAIFKPSPTGSADNPGIVATIMAICLYPFVQSARYLWGRVYGHGFSGFLLSSLGGIGALVGAMACGHYLRVGLTLPTQLWLPGGLLSWPVLFLWGLPIFWLWFLHPVIDLAQAVHGRFRQLAKEYAGPTCKWLLRASTIICPLSGRVWKPLLEATYDQPFVVRAIQAVAFLSSLTASGYAAWLAFWWVTALLLPWIGFLFYGSMLAWAVSGAVAIVAFAALVAITVGLLEFGELPFLAIVTSTLAVYAGYGYIGWTGLAWPFTDVAAVAAYCLGAGYGFPGLIRMLSNGFWSMVWNAIRPLSSKAYSDTNKDYVYFHHHVWTLISTGLLVWGAVTVCGTMSFGLLATIGVAAVTAYSAYGLIFKSTDHEAGTFMFSFVVALAGAYLACKLYIHMGWFGATWGGIVIGVVTLLALCLVINPALYLGCRETLFAAGKLGLAGPASTGFNRVNTWYLKQQQQMSELTTYIYEEDEKDKSGYREQFLQVSNLFITFGVWWLVHHFAVGAGTIFAWPAMLALPLLSYALVGKTLLKSGHGLPLVSSVLGLVAATYVGVAVWSMGSTPLMMPAAVGSAIFAWLAVVFILFAPIYTGLRKVTERWTVGWLGPLLSRVHDIVWTPFGWFGDKVATAMEGVVRFMKPLIVRIAKAYDRVRQAYAKVLEKIRGRR